MKKSTKNFLIGAGVTAAVGALAYVIYKSMTTSERTNQDTMEKNEPEEYSVGTPQDYVNHRKSFMKDDDVVVMQGAEVQAETKVEKSETHEVLLSGEEKSEDANEVEAETEDAKVEIIETENSKASDETEITTE